MMNAQWENFFYADNSKHEILVGCPIMKREWIIEEWYSNVISSSSVAELIPEFIFIMDCNEEPLYSKIHELAERYKTNLYIGHVDEVNRADVRDWKSDRFERMVYLRNELLNGVRKVSPEYFLSLDSDIIINHLSIKSMISNLDKYDAVGGKTFMGYRGTEFPSYGNFRPGSRSIYRENQNGIFRVDCIMAIKLMTPSAYNVDYVYADEGEDIGYSHNCYKSGLVLGWDGTFTSKHVMRKEDINKIDPRCGY